MNEPIRKYPHPSITNITETKFGLQAPYFQTKIDYIDGNSKTFTGILLKHKVMYRKRVIHHYSPFLLTHIDIETHLVRITHIFTDKTFKTYLNKRTGMPYRLEYARGKIKGIWILSSSNIKPIFFPDDLTKKCVTCPCYNDLIMTEFCCRLPEKP